MTDQEYLAAFEANIEGKLDGRQTMFASLTHSDRLFVLRRSFQWEVNNGGFHTFFFNSSGDYALDTPEVLRTIGAPEAASLLDAAIEVFGPCGPSRDVVKRRLQMKHFTPDQEQRIEDLTGQYFRLEDMGLSTADLLDAYLLAHR